ncbi:MAG TPA: catalase [Myxococcales bacterium]|nr:catalase [Myxococcales bacterium]
MLGVVPLLTSAIIAASPLTTDSGAPIGSNQNSKTAGPRGSVLLEDFTLIEKLARFDRERIPERVVHARGVGAYGTFESAGDFSALTKAKIFSAKGKRTPMFVRFSTVMHGGHSPETLRDPRGFALKFYTEEGNWDLVGNDLPVFFIRDAIKFPDMVHALKPSPVTNRQDPNRFFDFFSQVPESMHMITQLYSDLGIPANYRQMDGYGVHAFKFVNAKGEVHYVKFHYRSRQGVKTLTAEEAAKVQATDFQHATKDLYDALERGDRASWDLTAQVLEPKDLDQFSFDALDPTKVWPEDRVPSITLGRFTLERTPANYFEDTEQSAFSPAVQPPGIEPSEDRLLQGRLFAYSDTQRYRVGPNYLQLPVNHARAPVANNYQAGPMSNARPASDVNYEPSVTNALAETPAYAYSHAPVSGTTQQARIEKTDDFSQAGASYRRLDAAARARLVQNLAADLGQVKNAAVRARIVGFMLHADEEYGSKLAEAVGVSPEAARLAAR